MKVKFKSKIGRPLLSTAPKAMKPAKPKMAKPSGTKKGPSAQAFAHANANASFKRTASPSSTRPSKGMASIPMAMSPSSRPAKGMVPSSPLGIVSKQSSNTGGRPSGVRRSR